MRVRKFLQVKFLHFHCRRFISRRVFLLFSSFARQSLFDIFKFFVIFLDNSTTWAFCLLCHFVIDWIYNAFINDNTIQNMTLQLGSLENKCIYSAQNLCFSRFFKKHTEGYTRHLAIWFIEEPKIILNCDLFIEMDPSYWKTVLKWTSKTIMKVKTWTWNDIK